MSHIYFTEKREKFEYTIIRCFSKFSRTTAKFVHTNQVGRFNAYIKRNHDSGHAFLQVISKV